jgi:Phosphoinositide phospholipase C, Ca2+-dependent
VLDAEAEEVKTTASPRAYLCALIAAICVFAAACSSGGGGHEEPAPVAYPRDRKVRLNEVQVLGSHNSYHLETDFPVSDPHAEYSHLPLAEQLEAHGVRGFELDALNGPGDGEFQVGHTPVVDDKTNCTPLTTCLAAMKKWSDAHPGHVPLLVFIEPKVGSLDRVLDPKIGPWDADAVDRLDAQVRTALAGKLITPDEVRGLHPTLRDAVVRGGWPSLARTRGRIMVILNTSGETRDEFLESHLSLQRRAMFVTAAEHAPSAAVVKVDDPGRGRRIRRLVDEGFIVRTRADADLIEARNRDTRRRDIALASGAQVVMTDFEVPNPVVGGPYVVQIPAGTPARCNPVKAPKRCLPKDIENPNHLAKRSRGPS